MANITQIKHHPDPESIDWKYLDKETYLEIDGIINDGVKIFDPFIVDNFYPNNMFEELVEICTKPKLEDVDYSNQMNKWEEQLEIPQKFIDYAINKVKELVGTDDVVEGYHMYAHHQITSDGRRPVLPVHVDWSPGSYMVDLQIGGNRDWGFVAGYQNFICKPNQAVICQPQIDFHYRPSWGTDDPNAYYQAIFFHLLNKNHWRIESSRGISNRSEYLEKKYNFGKYFRETEVFKNYQNQRKLIFEEDYVRNVNQLVRENILPEIPWTEFPKEEDANVHDRKGVKPNTMEETNGR
jgi:hypothetical protein